MGGTRQSWCRSDATKDKNLTFLALPPDLQKPTRRPNTNIASDKDRIAMSRHPELDPKELRKILATPPPGAPGMTGPRAPQPAPHSDGAEPAACVAAAAAGQQQTPRPQFQSNQTGAVADAGPSQQLVQQVCGRDDAGRRRFSRPRKGRQPAAQAVPVRKVTSAWAPERMAGSMGALEILSDTQGVDFGPYLQRILQDVRENWYHLIPESAEMKKGKLAIEFAITKDGKVADMRLVATSGDVALDRAGVGQHHRIESVSAAAQRIHRAVSRAALPLLLQPRQG